MGVNFNNTSMSYSRYDNLITTIAIYFNGKPNVVIPKDTNKTLYCFGYIEDGSNVKTKEKFVFDENVPLCIKKLCNTPYGDLSKQEVKDIYNTLKNKTKSLIDVSVETSIYTINGFLEELKYCIDTGEEWYIG